MTQRSSPRAVAIDLLRPARFLTDAMLDPVRRDRWVGMLLAAFAALWTLYDTLANAGTDMNVDVGELVAWSRTPALGYKHPPLAVWLANLWFFVFPLQDWAAHLLAACTNALALWISWKVFSRWLEPQKRVLALAMLSWIPFYSFLALKLNANNLMTPLWAAATLWFLDSFVGRSKRAAALAGVAAAAALLTKYWSVYLVAGAGLSAILDRRRLSYFASAAPWISIAIGALVLAPHVYWLLTEGRAALQYATNASHDVNASPWRSLPYLRDLLAYAAGPLLAFALLRPSRTAIAQTWRPSDPDHALLARLFWISLLLPALLNLIWPTRLTAVWTFPNWTLFPVVLLAAPALVVGREQIVRAVAVAVALPLLAVCAAPVVAYAQHVTGATGQQAHFRQLAYTIASLWREQTSKPVRQIGGNRQLANGSAFYAPDRQAIYMDFSPPDLTGEPVIRDGVVLVCRQEDAWCLDLLDATSRQRSGVRHDVMLTRTFWGRTGRPAHYSILLIPPTP